MPTATKLMRILDKLDPDYIARVVERAHNIARETFPLDSDSVSSHAEFYDTITRYYRHHYAHTIAGGVDLPEDLVHADVRRHLDQAYRDYGGYEGAYTNAKKGRSGGMSAVLNAIASGLKQQQERQYIEHLFFTEVDPMDYDDIVTLMRDYLDRFGGLLSPADRARSPHDLARNYDTIIKSHARAMGTIKDLMRRV